jgi:hypothetical protein
MYRNQGESAAERSAAESNEQSVRENAVVSTNPEQTGLMGGVEADQPFDSARAAEDVDPQSTAPKQYRARKSGKRTKFVLVEEDSVPRKDLLYPEEPEILKGKRARKVVNYNQLVGNPN